MLLLLFRGLQNRPTQRESKPEARAPQLKGLALASCDLRLGPSRGGCEGGAHGLTGDEDSLGL